MLYVTYPELSGCVGKEVRDIQDLFVKFDSMFLGRLMVYSDDFILKKI